MNIEKIKNYNQKLLAILGTVIALIALVALFSLSYFFITEIQSSQRNKNQDDGILSDERIEELLEEKKRLQLISYEMPKLVDTLNMIYVIPVSHKTLNNAEYIDEGLTHLLDLSSSSNYKVDKRYSSSFYGDFNNILIYDYTEGKYNKLFSERINFEGFKTYYFENDILILFKASDSDTYKDGVVNQIDLKSLYIYSLNERSLKEIKLDQADISDYKFVENSMNMLISFGKDHDEDGMFNEFSEPTIIKLYDYQKGELKDIISERDTRELQLKLDGTTNN